MSDSVVAVGAVVAVARDVNNLLQPPRQPLPFSALPRHPVLWNNRMKIWNMKMATYLASEIRAAFAAGVGVDSTVAE